MINSYLKKKGIIPEELKIYLIVGVTLFILIAGLDLVIMFNNVEVDIDYEYVYSSVVLITLLLFLLLVISFSMLEDIEKIIKKGRKNDKEK